jgi:hypothetical protein
MSAVADEIWEILREVAEGQKENKEQILLLRESQKETERIIDKIQRETSREIEKVNKNVGRLTDRLGEFVEEAVRPAAVKLFRERGIDVHEVHRNITAKREGEGVEIDLLVINNKDVVIIECKSNLSVDDVNEHLERLEKAKRLVSSCENKRILGAVAGMVIPANVAAYAIRKGLYVIGQNGDHLELQNEASFKAKVW